MKVYTMKRLFFKVLFLVTLYIVIFIQDLILPLNALALIGMKEGDTPKEIILHDLNGKIFNVTDYFGHNPVILVFWELTKDESFLNYSLDELLFLNDTYNKYHEKTGLEIFGIYTPEEFGDIPNTEISEVRNLILSNKIQFPILIDKEFKFFGEYGVIALPSTIMIGKTGKIEFIYPSFPVTARPVISEKIIELIGVAKAEEKAKRTKQTGSDTRSHRLYRYALQMYKKGLLEQAFSSLKKSMVFDPDNAWVHNLMGIILWKRGIFGRSMEAFRSAIALDKNNVPAHLNYTVLLLEQGNYEEAERLLITSHAVQTKADLKIRAHHLLGILYWKTNKIDKAIAELEFAYNLLEISTPAVHDSSCSSFSVKLAILHDLSVLYSKKGNDKKALNLLHEAFHETLSLDASFNMEHLDKIGDLMTYE